MFQSKKDDNPKERDTAPEAVIQSATERSSRMDMARGKRIVKPKWY
jgi:hypothetical protein